MIYHLSVVRPLSKSKSSVYKNIELLPELRTLDLDRRFDGGDELERNEERAWEFLSQLQHLERLRLVDAGSYRLARTDTSSYPRETLWHVEYMDLTDKSYGGLDLWDTVHHDAPRERACDHVEHPNFRKPSNLSESTNPVVVDFSRENSEIWCFNFPLPDAVVDRLRKKQRRAELKWERDFLRSQRIKDQAELEMERRIGRSEKLDKLAEQKDQQRKEEVARLQPHKKWHAEVRSRRAGIAKGKGRAERLHLDDEIEWAREDWDSCFNDDYE
ncbi:hypothetical protein SLS56_010192 [Neofusicoccum ribis]|uniref:Uncharacterized protein n=1 Tax=Neofusicoccum ribis TaxID=45134 RepID=A0ABR3SF60_9PEZI